MYQLPFIFVLASIESLSKCAVDIFKSVITSRTGVVAGETGSVSTNPEAPVANALAIVCVLTAAWLLSWVVFVVLPTSVELLLITPSGVSTVTVCVPVPYVILTLYLDL